MKNPEETSYLDDFETHFAELETYYNKNKLKMNNLMEKVVRRSGSKIDIWL
jgi:hypothetical protein